MATKTDSIREFLNARARPEIASLYHLGMEVQVKAARDGGEPVKDKGRRSATPRWTDGDDVWSSFRVPWSSMTDEPRFEDRELGWSLEEHAEAIGMTGWCWGDQESAWVGFDFDHITGHAQGLTDEQLAAVLKAVEKIPWVEVRRSKSGRGFHLYVFLDPAPATTSHVEHAAIAHAILSHMTGVSGQDLQGDVDCYGAVVAHRVSENTIAVEVAGFMAIGADHTGCDMDVEVALLFAGGKYGLGTGVTGQAGFHLSSLLCAVGAFTIFFFSVAGVAGFDVAVFTA